MRSCVIVLLSIYAVIGLFLLYFAVLIFSPCQVEVWLKNETDSPYWIQNREGISGPEPFQLKPDERLLLYDESRGSYCITGKEGRYTIDFREYDHWFAKTHIETVYITVSGLSVDGTMNWHIRN